MCVFVLFHSNSDFFRSQWIILTGSLRNKNSTCPLLVTAEGNNKLSVDQFSCLSVFLSSSTCTSVISGPLAEDSHFSQAFPSKPVTRALLHSSPTIYLGLLPETPDAGDWHQLLYPERVLGGGLCSSSWSFSSDLAGSKSRYFPISHSPTPPNQASERICVHFGGCILIPNPLALPTSFLLLLC